MSQKNNTAPVMVEQTLSVTNIYDIIIHYNEFIMFRSPKQIGRNQHRALSSCCDTVMRNIEYYGCIGGLNDIDVRNIRYWALSNW